MDTPAVSSHAGTSAAILPDLKTWARQHRAAVVASVTVIGLINLWLWGLGRNDVLNAAYAIPDGGGYCALSESGVRQTIKHNGSVILPASASGGSYCCGFTFQVAMDVAQGRGLLKDKSAAEVRRFQKVWYGSIDGSEWKQCAQAVVESGIGREIDFEDAKPGDFVAFHRTNGIGHSVIFLGWMKDAAGKIVGVRYRSSQPSSNGVGDNIEYFADSGLGWKLEQVHRDRFFVGRLDRRWWSRLLYPFGS